MAVDLDFYLASAADGASAALGTATVLLCSPGGSFGAPAAGQGALVALGPGWWRVPADARDQPGAVVLLYATAADADPTAQAYSTSASGLIWIAGDSSPPPMPFWLGSAATNGYQPFPGASPTDPINPLSVLVRPPGATAFGPGAGTIAEADGPTRGYGWYWYGSVAGEVATSGDFLLTATCTPARPAAADYWIAPASTTPTPTPTTPTPTPLPTGPTGTGLCLTDPDLCTLITPAVSGQVVTVPPPNVGPPRVPVVVGSSIALPVQCRLRGTGAPAAYNPGDSLSARVYSAASSAGPSILAFVPSSAPTFLGTAGAGAAQGQILPVLHTADTLMMSPSNIYTLGIYRVPIGTQDLEEIARLVLPALSPALG